MESALIENETDNDHCYILIFIFFIILPFQFSFSLHHVWVNVLSFVFDKKRTPHPHVVFSLLLCPLSFHLYFLFLLFSLCCTELCQLKQITVSQTTRALGRCQSGCRVQKLITAGYKVNKNENNFLTSNIHACVVHVVFRLYIFPSIYLFHLV